MPIPISEVGFDFDGVIADTAEAFIRLACAEHGYCGFTREDITNFELENCLNIPQTLVEKIFTDILTDSIATELLPMPGAVESLERFAGIGTLTIITARPLKKPVFAWLERYFSGPTREKIRVIATGDHNDKVRHIHQHGLKYFIDDRAETCIQLAREAITPYVFNQPWNRNRHELQTVADWGEIRALVAHAEPELP
ncbi:MAG: hypothetical protein KJ630_23105 [Proteobacteria bacterium]|nr:hypothetical protein [Pseudomonadota bacterium]